MRVLTYLVVLRVWNYATALAHLQHCVSNSDFQVKVLRPEIFQHTLQNAGVFDRAARIQCCCILKRAVTGVLPQLPACRTMLVDHSHLLRAEALAAVLSSAGDMLIHAGTEHPYSAFCALNIYACTVQVRCKASTHTWVQWDLALAAHLVRCSEAHQ